MERRRVGRPTTAAREGEKAALGIRATPSLKRRLQEASEATGRSLSAEAEYRLERSFAVEDGLAGPMRPVLLHLISAFGAEGDPRDPHAYLAGMARAVAAMVDRFPGGPLSPAEWDVIAAGLRSRIAAAYANRETILSVWEALRPGGDAAVRKSAIERARNTSSERPARKPKA